MARLNNLKLPSDSPPAKQAGRSQTLLTQSSLVVESPDESRIKDRWQIKPTQILDPAYYSRTKPISKAVLESLAELSAYVNLDEGRRLLRWNISQRSKPSQRSRGVPKEQVLILRDVKLSLAEVKKRKLPSSCSDGEDQPPEAVPSAGPHSSQLTQPTRRSGSLELQHESSPGLKQDEPSLAGFNDTGQYEACDAGTPQEHDDMGNAGSAVPLSNEQHETTEAEISVLQTDRRSPLRDRNSAHSDGSFIPLSDHDGNASPVNAPLDLRSNPEAEDTLTSPEIGREGRFSDTPGYQSDGEDFQLSAFSDQTIMSIESTGKRYGHYEPGRHKNYSQHDLEGEGGSPLPKRIRRNGRVPDIGSPNSSTSKEKTTSRDKPHSQLPQTPISLRSSPSSSPDSSSALSQRSISDEPETPVNKLPRQPVPRSDQERALRSLAPGQGLSATAIELALEVCASDEVYIFDPLWFDVAKASFPIHAPKIPSSAKYILLPLHNAKQHWTIAIFDLRTFTIHHYDSLSDTWNPHHKETLLTLAKSMVPTCSSEWTAEPGTTTRQTNAYDSGVFTIIAAVYMVGGLEQASDPDCMQWRIALKALVGSTDVEADLDRVSTLFEKDSLSSGIAENGHGYEDSDSPQAQTHVALQKFTHSITDLRQAQTGLSSAVEIIKIMTVLIARSTDTLCNLSEQEARLHDEVIRYQTFVHSHSEFPSFTNEEIMAVLRLNLNAGKKKLNGLTAKLDKAQAQSQRLEVTLTVAQQLSERYRDGMIKLNEGAKGRQARVRQLKTEYQNALRAIEEADGDAGWLNESDAAIKINNE